MTEIRFAGFGGQGIIRSGIIVGMAASIYDNKFSTMNQSFGPEARGGACSAELLIAETEILYPYLTEADILVAMSQEGYDKFEPSVKDTGKLLIDAELVRPKHDGKNVFRIHATRFAEDLGNRIVANVVMLGFFTCVTGIVSVEAMKKAIPESVPKRYLNLNLKAFDKGYAYGEEISSR